MKFNSVYIIAEIGINHCDDMEIAHQLIDDCKEAGADTVKFQSFRTELLVLPDAPRMPYQTTDRTGDVTQFEMLKKVELSDEQHYKLQEHCNKIDVDFVSTPYDVPSLELLEKLNLPFIKIASTDVTNLPFLRRAAAGGRNIICSSGASDLWELSMVVDAFDNENNHDHLSLLHCLSYYPAPLEEINLAAIRNMENAFNVPVGFSDHTQSEEVGAWAVASGAKLLEKHITFDKSAKGPDHAASLTPDEFRNYVSRVRIFGQAMGDGINYIEVFRSPS
jgi:sialic acid synthase SpsE